MNREIRLHVDAKSCQVCGPCLAGEVCKVRAIVHFDPDESPYLDMSRCYDCRLCIPACPYQAVKIYEGY